MTEIHENKMTFRVTGMTCATCSRIVERAISKVPGVEFVSVNLATESTFVIADDSVTFEQLNDAVEKSGYHILKDAPDDLDEIRYREARRDLFFILALGVPMSFLMFMHMVFGMHFAWYGLMEIFVGGVAIFWGGRKTLRGAWIALSHAHTNMDTLISISATAAWLTAVMNYAGVPIPSFGTVGVMILMLHLIGRYIESRLRDRAAKQVKMLLTLQPREARVINDGVELMVPVDAVKPETVIQVNPGERIPLDGIVVEGLSGVDESLLTGESMPVTKKADSEVTGGAMNLSGVLLIRTTKIGEDTFLSKMLELVREAQGGKVPLQALADRITLKFIPTVIGLAILSAVSWFFFFDTLSAFFAPIAAKLPWPTAFTSPAGAAAYAFVATLVIACPCALGLATPLALVASTGEASKNGLLIRNAEAIQTLHEVDFAVLDKTGTLTKGEPKVTQYTLPDDARPFVYAIESVSGHPVARAVTQSLGEVEFQKPDEVSEIPGEGVKGLWGKDEWFAGRPLERARWLDEDTLARTLVEIRHNNEPVGFFAINDPLRDDSKGAITDLKHLGITPMMATGDGKTVALEIAKETGIDEVKWEVRPEDKLSIVHNLQQSGKRVLMAGDGINDAAALKGAHVGVAMGGGMDLAVDSADIVILKGGLSKIVAAVKISDKTWSVIRQNLFGAFFYNVIAIPLAMSGLLHPIAAELAMAASSITVILNSMRISGSAEK
ncbi:cation-translocating P-type ATPase [Synergistaceae bacterium OttesenSCG-928-D05]|nr:cation-translocating P-type ATPase [Synergistaceae bacterium OttesenSCG-928-D05]